MRGSDRTSGSPFSYVDLKSRVPAMHPLGTIEAIADDALVSLDVDFARLYEGTGRQLIAPERLLRASLAQAFYSVSFVFAHLGISIYKRQGIALWLALLATPTALLAWASNLPAFAMLPNSRRVYAWHARPHRTLAFLAEVNNGGGTASVFAAYRVQPRTFLHRATFPHSTPWLSDPRRCRISR